MGLKDIVIEVMLQVVFASLMVSSADLPPYKQL